MLKVIFISLFFSLNAFANGGCLNFDASRALYFEALTDYLFSSEEKVGPFFDYLKSSGIDPTPMDISPFPLMITDTEAHLLVRFENGNAQSCGTLRVPMRKMCRSVGLEFHGVATLSLDPIPAAQLGEMEQAICL
jgi:hypothetical protein